MGKGDGDCANRPAMTLDAPAASFTVENPHPPHINPDQALVQYVQLVALDKLLPMREYRREPGAEHAFRDQAWWDEYTEDVARNGMLEAVVIDYDPDTGLGYVSEGCHRIGVAEQLGWDRVPARVITGRIHAPEGSPRRAALRQLTEPGALVDDHDAVPQYVRPSVVGLADPNPDVAAPFIDASLARSAGGRGLWVFP